MSLFKINAPSTKSAFEPSSLLSRRQRIQEPPYIPSSENILNMWFSVYPEQSASINKTYLTGINEIIKEARFDNILDDERFGVQNNHIVIKVINITTGGDIKISGTSISESTAIPVSDDSETITVDNSTNQLYQTTKKWLEITEVNITSGTITGLEYQTIILGYTDIGNRDFAISGYRLEALAGGSGHKSDIRFFIEKIQDDGGKKLQLYY